MRVKAYQQDCTRDSVSGNMRESLPNKLFKIHLFRSREITNATRPRFPLRDIARLTHVVDYGRHPQRDADQEQAHGEQKTSRRDDRPSGPGRKFPGIDELLIRTDRVGLAPFTFALSPRPMIPSPGLVQLLRTAEDLLLLQLVGYVQRHVVVVVVMDLSESINVPCGYS